MGLARVPLSIKWTIRVFCKSVFEISDAVLDKLQCLRFICMMTRLSVSDRNHTCRKEGSQRLISQSAVTLVYMYLLSHS